MQKASTLALDPAMPAQSKAAGKAVKATGIVHHPARGILLVLGATFTFACNDSISKYLVAEYPVPLVMAIRYIVHTMLMLALLGPIHGRGLMRTNRTGLVIVRAVSLVAGSLLVGMAFQRMPVAETTAIVYLIPLCMTLCARPVLGERIGVVGWISAVLGFAGILLIVRPGSGLDPLGVVLALGNVAVGVVYYLLSRVLARTEQTVAMLFHVALIGAISFGLALPWYWFGTTPDAFDIVLFLLLGLSGGLGHFLITAAYRYAEASLLGPISYTHLLWSGLFGWLIFHHMPDAPTILGMAVIAASGVLVAMRARLSKG